MYVCIGNKYCLNHGYVFQYITDCVKTDDSEVRRLITAEATYNPRDILGHPTVKLLTAWKNFLIVLAKNDVSYIIIFPSINFS